MNPEERKEYRAKYYQEHKRKWKDYREKRKEKRRIYRKKYNREHREQDAAYGKVYRQTHREQEAARQRRFRERHKEEMWVRNRVNRRIAGKDVLHARRVAEFIPLKPNCQMCNSAKKLEHHHPDYTKPRETVTLCKLCHEKLHSSPTTMSM